MNNLEAVDGLFADIAEHGVLNDLTTSEGRQQVQLLQQLGQTYVPRIQQAFEASGGSLADFRDEMGRVGGGIRSQLIEQFMSLGDEFGTATDKANDLMIQMGLVPENVTTMYSLMGDRGRESSAGNVGAVHRRSDRNRCSCGSAPPWRPAISCRPADRRTFAQGSAVRSRSMPTWRRS